ncbi:MAG: YraN family protein [Patescibacteria group bacterium]
MANIGQLGEQIAADYLKKQGYKILARNFKTKLSELDLVAKKGRVLVFVEVKAGATNQNFFPEEHFNKAKIKKLKKAIEIYLISEKIKLEKQAIRLDLVAIELDNGSLKALRHYQNIETK